MKPVLVFRHIACEGPGYLGEFLAARDIPCRVIRVDEGEAVPGHIGDARALAFMGGPMSVNDPLPWVARELALIRRAGAEGIPVLGHCLGGQLIAKALGAGVGANPVKEIGWHEIAATDAARDLHRRIPARFEGFHWHGETFALPPGATLLMSSAHCRHQAFIRDRALALQFHVEMTGQMVQEWCAEYHDELALHTGRTAVQGEGEMTARLEQRIAALHRVADALYDYWLGLA